MPEITCPSCRTRQEIQAGSEYRCAECHIEWDIVRCGNCGEGFQARKEVTSWTCPNCGVHHERGLARRRSPALVPAAFGVLVVAAVVVVAFVAFGGTTDESLRRDLCKDVSEIQLLRVDALARSKAALEEDRAAFEAAGDDETAEKVADVMAAIEDYRTAIEGDQDTGPASEALATSIGKLPC